jgi:quercetin dioxygenase-like cupin family protein
MPRMRTLQKSVWTPAAACLLAVAGLNARQDDKVVPVHEEPRHRLVFDSPGTKILDVQIPPGDTTLFHTHSDPILYVNMSSSQTRSQTLGREWTGSDTTRSPARIVAEVQAPPRPGRMNSVTSYATQPLTHRVNNVGQTLFRLIGITNASPGDESTAPSADFAATPELENRWFRGYRWSLGERATAEHRHANPVAIVIVAGQASVAGTTLVPLPPAGAYAFLDADVPHTLQAVGGAAEIVEVEVRRPRHTPEETSVQ